MPAQSKAQQRFMGMVHATQKGDMNSPSAEVSKAADSMSDKDAKDFASTSHKGLPDKIKELIIREARGVKTITKEYSEVVDQIQKHLDLYKQTKGTPAEKQHIQQLKQLNNKKKALANELDQKVSGLYKDAELKVDEMNTTANVQGYDSPNAFTKRGDEKTSAKKQADLTGYSVVKEGLYYVGYNKGRGQGKGVFKDSYSSYKDAKKAKRWAAGLIGFYATVKTYADFFEFHDMLDQQNRVIEKFRTGVSSDHLADVVPDEMVDALTLAGDTDEVIEKISRYEGLASTVKLSPPTHGLENATVRQAQNQIIEMIPSLVKGQ
jgi:hypothetical protein